MHLAISTIPQTEFDFNIVREELQLNNSHDLVSDRIKFNYIDNNIDN